MTTETDRPLWRVRTSWASSPGRRLITVFKWKPDYHGTGGYAAVRSFATFEQVRVFIEGAS